MSPTLERSPKVVLTTAGDQEEPHKITRTVAIVVADDVITILMRSPNVGMGWTDGGWERSSSSLFSFIPCNFPTRKKHTNTHLFLCRVVILSLWFHVLCSLLPVLSWSVFDFTHRKCLPCCSPVSLAAEKFHLVHSTPLSCFWFLSLLPCACASVCLKSQNVSPSFLGWPPQLFAWRLLQWLSIFSINFACLLTSPMANNFGGRGARRQFQFQTWLWKSPRSRSISRTSLYFTSVRSVHVESVYRRRRWRTTKVMMVAHTNAIRSSSHALPTHNVVGRLHHHHYHWARWAAAAANATADTEEGLSCLDWGKREIKETINDWI